VNVRAFSLALIAILAFTVPSFADGPVRIQDPEKFVVGIFGSPPRVVSVEDIGFVYFRFNFKMTGTGWVLANFNFKSETEELFPKDFVAK
jgi:hypothetical protein